jgi:hypothetical protein
MRVAPHSLSSWSSCGQRAGDDVLELILATGPVLTVDAELLSIDPVDAPAVPETSIHDGQPLSMRDAERQHIESVLKQTKGVIEGPEGAARILNLNPNTLRSRMRKLGVVGKPTRQDASATPMASWRQNPLGALSCERTA